MNDELSVSVIIPVYNAERTLTAAVESVVEQENVLQIILVEDGSSDNSLAICNALLKKYHKVKLLQHNGGSNRGASASRNLGLNYSLGLWIQFLDADDELLPDKLRNNFTVIRRKPDADFIVGNYLKRKDGSDTKFNHDKDIWLGLIRSSLGITSANLWRKEKLLEVSGWNENLSSSQEYDLLFRLFKAGAKIAYDDSFSTVIKYQENSISTSKSRAEANAINRIQLRIDIYNYLRSAGQLTWNRRIAIHGYVFKNLGYLSNKDSIGFNLNFFLVLLYRIVELFRSER